MKTFALVILTIVLGAVSATMLHKEVVSLEYGKKYDSNIILPDSATGKSALITAVAARPALLVQFNPATMLRSELELSSEEEDAFAENTIERAGLVINGKHLFSHLTMAGFRAEALKSVSGNRYYATEDYRLGLNVGRYLGPRTNIEGVLTGSQKTFPSLYRNSITDRAKKSYYYDYREAVLEFSGTRLQTAWLTLYASLNGGYRDYFHDTHDSDYVGYLPVIDYIDITSGDTIYRSPGDTAIPLYAPNIHQKDHSLSLSLSAAFTPVTGLTLSPRFSGRRLFSNDAYFNGRTLTAGVTARFHLAPSTLRLSYDLSQDYYQDRKDDAEGRLETAQTVGFTYGYDLSRELQVQCSYYYRSFNSSANFDDYTKKVIGASLIWTR